MLLKDHAAKSKHGQHVEAGLTLQRWSRFPFCFEFSQGDKGVAPRTCGTARDEPTLKCAVSLTRYGQR